MDLIIRIALVGIIVSIINHIIKNAGGKDEYGMVVGLVGFILILTWVIPYIIDLFHTIQSLFKIV